MKKIVLGIVIVMVSFSVATSDARGPQEAFVAAVRSAQQGDRDFAFMHYQKMVQSDVRPAEKAIALFATGEYYYLMREYAQAQAAFEKYFTVEQKRDSDAVLFALVYCLKIAQQQGDVVSVEKFMDRIRSFRRQGYVFKNVQKYIYRSPLYRAHTAVYSIDGIAFYAEGVSLANVTY